MTRTPDSQPASIPGMFKTTVRKWGLVLLTSVILAIATSIPQFSLWWVRGSNWNGSCAYSDPDEVAYFAYTNALMSGRPRRNDPYSGRDNSSFESLFSLQFLPPYAIGLTAKFLGISADAAFMMLLPLATVASFLVIVWLFSEITGNATLSIVAAVCVIAFATAAAHSPIHILRGIETGYSPFPFLRRYIPALPFPLFIASTVFTWRALTKNPWWAAVAAVALTALVYSYFFLWTALAAWLFTILSLWFIARPGDRVRTLQVSGILIAIAAPALAIYGWLLTHRPSAMDQGQILQLRRAPDLLRAPELYGALILAILIYFSARGIVSYRDRRVLFTASFAIAPFFVFNQQVVTGLSLQPFHYEEFAANYWVVLSAFFALGILRPDIPKRIVLYLAIAGVALAIFLGTRNASIMKDSNIRIDEVRPAALRMREEAGRGTVFASDRFLTHSLPAITDKPVLWARYLYTFSTVDVVEQKKRYHQYLYYSGLDKSQFRQLLQDDFTAQWEIFGPDRVNPVLSASYTPIAAEDIRLAVEEYGGFIRSYNETLAADPQLSYAIVTPGENLSNLDRWYERDAGENLGEFVLYRIEIKQQPK